MVKKNKLVLGLTLGALALGCATFAFAQQTSVDYSPLRECDCDKKCRKGDHRGCKHNDKRDKRAKKGGKPHHPSMHRPGPHNPMPHRPGMPVPPPRHK